jgi:hypothetical protein
MFASKKHVPKYVLCYANISVTRTLSSIIREFFAEFMKLRSPSSLERQPVLIPFYFHGRGNCEGRNYRLEINQTPFNALVAKRLTKFSTAVIVINGINRL